MYEIQYDNVQTPSNLNNCLIKTFFWMFLGVLATALVATFSYTTGITENFAYSGGLYIAAIIEIAVVLVFSLMFRKASANTVMVLFFLYSMISGLTISTIFFVFEVESIIIALFASAGLFGVLAYMGYKTNRDISSLGTICMVGLIIAIILSIINIFLGNGLLYIILNWAVLAIFIGFTVYDMNKIKNILASSEYDSEKVAIYGAMELYLDFINIFLRLLMLFGKRRN